MSDNYTVIGDPHLKNKNLDFGAKLFQQVETLGNTAIWLGDLQDTKEVVRSKVLNSYYRYFKSSKLHHIVLVGNHDWHNLECLEHSLETLGALPNVTIVDSPMIIDDMVFLPYVHDQAQLKQHLKTFAGAKTLWCHVDISGFDYGNGHLCEGGLGLDDFKSFGRVISGHFHKHQIQDNLVYLGSPFSHSFGESNQHKFLGVYDARTNVLGFLPTPFPQHVSLRLNIEQEGAKATLDQFLEENTDNIIRIQLFGKPDVCAKFNDKYRPLYEEKYKIKFEDKSEGLLDLGANLDETLDNRSQFMEWSKNIRKLDPETIKLGMEILEALNVK